MLMALAVFAFVGTSNITYAQCSGKTASTVSGKKSCAKTCASKLAANDASIEKKVCEKSGKVSYMRKATCEKSGKTSFTPVQYDAGSKKFVNVAPAASDVQLVSGGEKKMCAKSAAAAAKLASNDANIEAKTCAKSGKVSYYSKQTCAKSGKVSMAPVKYCADSKKFVNAAPAADVMLAGGEKKMCSKSAAAKLASNDANIEAKTCAKSGKVSYYSKQTCAKSGKVSMTPVKFCADSKKFVNVAPEGEVKSTLTGGSKNSSTVNGMQVEKKACTKAEKKACAKSKKACAGKAKKTSMQGSQK